MAKEKEKVRFMEYHLVELLGEITGWERERHHSSYV